MYNTFKISKTILEEESKVRGNKLPGLETQSFRLPKDEKQIKWNKFKSLKLDP